MIGVVIAIHVVICVLLIAMILIQRGRGGGLVDTFSDVESMFGTKTNAFLTRATTILSTLFFITCLGLALLSARLNRSLMEDSKPTETIPVRTGQVPVVPSGDDKNVAPAQEQPKQEAPKAE